MSSSDAWLGPPGPMAHPDASESHTRFIPREELAANTGIAPWRPRVFGKPTAPVPSAEFERLPEHDQGRPAHRHPKGRLPGAQDFTPLSAAAAAGATVEDPSAGQRQRVPNRPPAQGASPQAGRPTQALPSHAPPAPADDEATATTPDEGISDELREQLLAEWRAEADAALESQLGEARQSGYQDGYRDGLVALDSFKESFAQQTTLQVNQLMAGLDREWQQLEALLAQRVMRIATELARQVVRSELQQRPLLIEAVAQEALAALMKQARQVSIQLHPDDHALVAEHCAESVQAFGARLIAQPTMLRGGCQVDSDLGSIDARIDTRWQQAALALGTDVPWTAPQAPPSPSPDAAAVPPSAPSAAAAASGAEPAAPASTQTAARPPAETAAAPVVNLADPLAADPERPEAAATDAGAGAASSHAPSAADEDRP